MTVLWQRSDSSQILLEVNAENDVCVVLLAGECIALHSLKLPRLRSAEQRQAIRFALEEQLASDLDTLLFVTSEDKLSGQVNVAVMEKKWFEQQIAQWQTKQLRPTMAIPNYLALPFEDEAWSILFDRDTVIVRTAVNHGFSIALDNAPVFFNLFFKKNPERKPKKFFIYEVDFLEKKINDDAWLRHYHIPIAVKKKSARDFFNMESIAEYSPINLLQGHYRPKMHPTQWHAQWRRCGRIALIWLGFLFFSHAVQLLWFQHALAVANQKVLQVYQSLFPNSTTALAPRLRTRELLNRYEKVQNNAVFLKLLSVAGKTALSFPDIQINNIEFKKSTLSFSVTATNPADVSAWVNAMEKDKLVVTCERVSGNGYRLSVIGYQ